jgi:hypothetical protein
MLKFHRAQSAFGLVFVASFLLCGCQQAGLQSASGQSAKSAAPPPPQGYTCCNLHYENDWINDGNYAQHPFIPAGTPAKVTGYGRYRASVDIGGKPMRLGQDYGRAQETLEKWVAKMIVETDPKPKIAGYSADVREAIRQGRVMKGMSREQVIISVGYPMTSETPALDSEIWRHWVSSFGAYQVLWDDKGRVKEIIADPTVTSMIVYQAKKK